MLRILKEQKGKAADLEREGEQENELEEADQHHLKIINSASYIKISHHHPSCIVSVVVITCHLLLTS